MTTSHSATAPSVREQPWTSSEADELRRLEVLHGYRVLDTEPEEAFDDLTRLAAALCATPMATVTLVDRDRQWFKSRVGVDVCETEREVSLCSRAIERSEVLVVPDTRVDPRFATNRLVTGPPFIRFYAGAPLTADGCALGTLCVFDTEPRTLSAQQLGQLTVLARQVVSQLQLRRDREDLAQQVLARARAEGDLRAQQSLTDGMLSRWRLLVENSPVPVAVIGIDGYFAYANPKALELYDAVDVADLSLKPAIDFATKSQQASTRALFARVLSGETVTNYPWQLLRRDGVVLATTVNAAAIQFDGAPAVQVELRDVTEERRAEDAIRQSEQLFRALFGQSPVGMSECLPDGSIVRVNDELCRMLGYPRDELVGRDAASLLAEPSEADALRADFAGLKHNGNYFAQRSYRRKDGAVVHAHVGVAAVHDEHGEVTRWLGTATDISDQVRAERELSAAHEELRRRQIFTNALLDSVDVGIVACDENAELTVFNRTSQQWHGVVPDRDSPAASSELASQFDLYDDDGSVLSEDRVPLLRALRDGAVVDAEIVISPYALAATRVQCSGRSMVDSDGKLLGAVIAMTDVTALRAQQRALQASETRFRATFDNDPAGLVVLSRDAQIVQVNKAFGKLVGLSEPTAADALVMADLFGAGDGAGFELMLEQARNDPGQPFTAERQLIAVGGRPLWCLVTVIDLPDPQMGRCILLQAEDITMRKEAEQRLTRQAMFDALTGLPNRVMLLDRIETAIARLQRHQSSELYALFCDLDGFKAVNDTHGHDAGDALLAEIAERLRAAVRPADTVARLGGDEFVVLCEELSGPEDASVVARRIEEAVADPVAWSGHQLSVTASIGIARGSAQTSPEELLRHADTAMYQAKRLGKNRHETFDEDMRARSASRVRVESELRAALADGSLEAHYQPILRLSDEKTIGFEALARIRRPDGTLLMPNDFIPVAEDSGLIVPLGTQMLNSSCKQIAHWRAATGRPLRLSVNLSARQAARSNLEDVVLGACEQAGLDPDGLCLELTESVLLEAARSTLRKLEGLRDAGVRIGIDDFGTGYASLRYLRQLPVTFLKVDREFVDRMATSHNDAVIVQTVMRLATDLDLDCVVEGIETREQLDMLDTTRALGQGYLFSRPVDAGQATELLLDSKP